MNEKAVCQRCGGTHDVIDFWVGGKEVVMCLDCRFELFGKKLGSSNKENDKQ